MRLELGVRMTYIDYIITLPFQISVDFWVNEDIAKSTWVGASTPTGQK